MHSHIQHARAPHLASERPRGSIRQSAPPAGDSPPQRRRRATQHGRARATSGVAVDGGGGIAVGGAAVVVGRKYGPAAVRKEELPRARAVASGPRGGRGGGRAPRGRHGGRRAPHRTHLSLSARLRPPFFLSPPYTYAHNLGHPSAAHSRVRRRRRRPLALPPPPPSGARTRAKASARDVRVDTDLPPPPPPSPAVAERAPPGRCALGAVTEAGRRAPRALTATAHAYKKPAEGASAALRSPVSARFARTSPSK